MSAHVKGVVQGALVAVVGRGFRDDFLHDVAVGVILVVDLGSRSAVAADGGELVERVVGVGS